MIPSDFYERFRLNTSLLAIGTGLVLGLFLTAFVPFLKPLYRVAVIPLGGLFGFLVNLRIVHNYFKGKMRGVFEYVYRESLLEPAIDLAISNARQSGFEAVLEVESLALFKTLMLQAEIRTEEDKFIYYMAAAKAANAGSEDRNSLTALKLAVALKPKDMVVNFKLARTFERIGSAQEAIEAYEAAFQEPSIDSEALKGFLAAQVQRVKEKGPEQRSPIPGLIYQLM